MPRMLIVALLALALPLYAAEPKKVVLIAGKKSHGPEGNGQHDYNWSAKLLKTALDASNVKEQIKVEYHLNGWPKDERALDGAATIMVISDGRDGDKFSEALHIETPERVVAVQKLMDGGCGLVLFHFSTFTPDAYAKQSFEWTGGYFDWETDGKQKWYSAITTLAGADVQLATPDHPTARGVKPFKLGREEFYYNIRFDPADKAVTPVLSVPALNGRDEWGKTVAWCRERENKSRGFATTCGHYYDNWKNDDFRKLICNAIVWTAKADVPAGGVETKFFTHEEIDAKLGTRDAPGNP